VNYYLRTIAFLIVFAGVAAAGLYAPIASALGYIGHYCLGPERQWWGRGIKEMGLRVSYIFGLMTAIGMILNWRRLRFGEKLLVSQEWLVLGFLAIVWLTVLVGPSTRNLYLEVDHPSVKMTKVVLFAFMLTHVMTRFKHLDLLLWLLVIGAANLGWQAFQESPSRFISGRLETVGGTDFHDANFLAAFFVIVLPLIGVQFMRSRWLGKAICLVAGVLAVDGVVLCRSRGAVVGLAAAALGALMASPSKLRGKILLGLVVVAIGGYRLADPAFFHRTSTITRSKEERDVSAQSRIEIWKGGVRMMEAHPLGVGAGNFQQAIGTYSPATPERDAHNTFVRCGGELGVPGLALVVAMIVNAWLILRRTSREAVVLPEKRREDVQYLNAGLTASLFAMVGVSLTMTLLYMESFWWFLLLPVCVARAMANEKEDLNQAVVMELSTT